MQIEPAPGHDPVLITHANHLLRPGNHGEVASRQLRDELRIEKRLLVGAYSNADDLIGQTRKLSVEREELIWLLCRVVCFWDITNVSDVDGDAVERDIKAALAARGYAASHIARAAMSKRPGGGS